MGLEIILLMRKMASFQTTACNVAIYRLSEVSVLSPSTGKQWKKAEKAVGRFPLPKRNHHYDISMRKKQRTNITNHDIYEKNHPYLDQNVILCQKRQARRSPRPHHLPTNQPPRVHDRKDFLSTGISDMAALKRPNLSDQPRESLLVTTNSYSKNSVILVRGKKLLQSHKSTTWKT